MTAKYQSYVFHIPVTHITHITATYFNHMAASYQPHETQISAWYQPYINHMTAIYQPYLIQMTAYIGYKSAIWHTNISQILAKPGIGIGFHSILMLISDTHHMFPGKRHNLKDLFISCLFWKIVLVQESEFILTLCV